MATDNDLELLKKFSAAVEKTEDNGVVQLHVMPDRIIAEIRARIKELEYRKQIGEALNANTTNNHEQEIQTLIQSIAYSEKQVIIYRDLLTKGFLPGILKSYNASLELHQASIIDVTKRIPEIKKAMEIKTEKAKAESEKLGKLIEQYEKLIFLVLEKSLK